MSERAVILAGGKGSRLAPFTTVLPKPLLPVGNRAILEIVVDQLRHYGFTDLTFAVGYLAHLIKAVFGDGSDRHVSIDYHHEQVPLGTAGPLATIERIDGTFLAMNGDVLTALDFRELVDAHRAQGNLLTVASHRRIVRADYGVIHAAAGEGPMHRVEGYEEKPEMPYLVSMGVYVLEPAALAYLPVGEPFDIPDLVLKLLAAGEPVGAYLTEDYWLDIGRHDDYQRANDEFDRVLPELLPRDTALPPPSVLPPHPELPQT